MTQTGSYRFVRRIGTESIWTLNITGGSQTTTSERASQCRIALKKDKEKTGLPDLPIKGPVKTAK